MTRSGNHSFVRSQTTIKQMAKDADSIKRQKQTGIYTPFAYPLGTGENERHAAALQKLNRK